MVEVICLCEHADRSVTYVYQPPQELSHQYRNWGQFNLLKNRIKIELTPISEKIRFWDFSQAKILVESGSKEAEKFLGQPGL